MSQGDPGQKQGKLPADAADVQDGGANDTNVIALIQCEPALEAQAGFVLYISAGQTLTFRSRFAGFASNAQHAVQSNKYWTHMVHEHWSTSSVAPRV